MRITINGQSKIIKANSHKADCPSCNVGTGSKHNLHCQYAFTGFPNHKTKNKKLSKLKAIINIIKL